MLLFNSGRHAAAYRYAVKVTENFPRSPLGFNNLGQYHMATGDLKKAEAAFRHALDLAPSYTLAREGLAAVAIRRDEQKRTAHQELSAELP